MMSLNGALTSAKAGNFVSNQYFSSDQSLHYYKGKFYYEDGAVVTREFLETQDFAKGETWYTKKPFNEVDNCKLEEMHLKSNGCMLSGTSYEECFI